jgi:hypothetical protein
LKVDAQKNAPTEQPIRQTNWAELVDSAPVRCAVELLLPKDAEHVDRHQSARDIGVGR